MALKPRIVESPQIRLIDLKSKPFFIVASIEVGNTTTKCILTATNMETGKTHIVNKVVRMTRDVCSPGSGEVPNRASPKTPTFQKQFMPVQKTKALYLNFTYMFPTALYINDHRFC